MNKRGFLVFFCILAFLPTVSPEKYYCEVVNQDLVRQNITEQGKDFKIEFRDSEGAIVGYCKELLNGRGTITFIDGTETDIHYAVVYNAHTAGFPNKEKLLCDIRGNIIQIKWNTLAAPIGGRNKYVKLLENFFGKGLRQIILEEQETLIGMSGLERLRYIVSKYKIEIVLALFTGGMIFYVCGLPAFIIVLLKTGSFWRSVGALMASGVLLSLCYNGGMLLGATLSPRYCYVVAILFTVLGFISIIKVAPSMGGHQQQSQQQHVVLSFNPPKGEEKK